MTLTQQWRYLYLTGSGFYILFPAKGIVSYKTSHFQPSVRSFKRNLFTGNKLNKINYLKIPKKHRGPRV